MNSQDQTSVPERGAASIKVELSGGIITVKHGTDGDAVLATWNANLGDWDKLWDTINQLKAAGIK